MTSVAPPPSASNTGDPPRRPERRRARARPGVSLLAAGEGMVWLTGGALSLAVAMILGLLALVIHHGVGTFWPMKIERASLKDGTQVMGEVTRVEPYLLTRQFAANLSGPSAQHALEALGDRDSLNTARRLFRVGNFEITQNHYQWVSDFELSVQAMELPEWAILAERVEWGRFVGLLRRFVVRHPREVNPDEQDLELLANSIESAVTVLPEDRQAEVSSALVPLREYIANIRRENVRQFLATIPSEGNWEAVLDDGTAVSIEAIDDPTRVTELRQSWSEPVAAWGRFENEHRAARERYLRRRELERHDIGRVNLKIERARLDVRAAELATGTTFLDQLEELRNLQTQIAAVENEWKATLDRWEVFRRLPQPLLKQVEPIEKAAQALRDAGKAALEEQLTETRARAAELESESARLDPRLRAAGERFLQAHRDGELETAGIQRSIRSLNDENDRNQLFLETADGAETPLALANIVRAYPANRLTGVQSWGVYFSRWWEFLSDEPREANSEGGVFPAIFGTVAMTLIMSLAVVPFGVLAALYLREYAKGGPIVSAVRISINNLAGVPSIVFGVFGLGFFCYLVGAFVDGGAKNAGFQPWPPYLWYLGLLALAVVALTAFTLGVRAPSGGTEGRGMWLGRAALMLWLGATVWLVILIFANPYFNGLFAENLPNPTMGKGGLLWSSLTLALLTLPVVIVSTEEALSAVPNSMREGSYACGAGKWQTIRHIVLPQAMPGIMTGMILAMARGAGEVAPLMLVGAVKLAPELPIDATAPFVHAERSFMHLGFHIYDLGFQSQNSEAAKPMVFTTTLLLIAIVATLNIAAVWLRGRLRRRFRSGQF